MDWRTNKTKVGQTITTKTKTKTGMKAVKIEKLIL
jgi:hypothetical protein